jgi:hypothetical protein
MAVQHVAEVRRLPDHPPCVHRHLVYTFISAMHHKTHIHAVGRRGLEPRTSTLDLAERCANEYPHLESGERHAPSYVVRLAPEHSFLRLLVPTPISLLPRLIALSTVLITVRVPNLIRGAMWCGPPLRRTQLEAMKRLFKFECA